MKRLLFALSISAALVSSGAVEPFKPGEKVVFLGDSITHGGWFEDYLQLWWALKHPGDGITIYNCGVGGQRAAGGFNRLDWEVKPLNPDRVFVMFGMNDVARDRRWEPPETPEKIRLRKELTDIYVTDLTKIVKGVRELGAKPVLITPTPFDEYGNYQPTNVARSVGTDEPGLRSFAERARAIAAEEKTDTVEFYNELLPMLKNHPEMKFLKDRVHPGQAGHLIMAALILREMGEENHVERTEFDAAKSLRFTYAPKRLPFPAVEEFVEDEKVYPLSKAWNSEILVFKGLKGGKYTLKLGGRIAGEYTAEELVKGVDIGGITDPKRCSPTMTQAFETYRTWKEFHWMQHGQRVLAQTFVQVRKLGGDVNDFNSCMRKYLEWIGNYRISKSLEQYYYYYGMQIATFYDRFKSQKADLARREELRASVNAVRPAPYEVELVQTP